MLGSQATRVKGDGTVHPNGAAAELPAVVESGMCHLNRAETLGGSRKTWLSLQIPAKKLRGGRTIGMERGSGSVVDAGPFLCSSQDNVAHREGHRLELGSRRVTKHLEMVGC